jgi:hypothetical protein
LFYGATIGGAAAIGGADWRFCIALGIGVWLGHILGLHDSAGMGRYGDQNELFKLWGQGTWSSSVDGKIHSKPGFVLSFLGMLAYGLLTVAVGFGATYLPWFWTYRGWPLIAAAAAVPVIYTLTWVVFDKKPYGWPRGAEPPLALAEWFVGAGFGIAAANLVPV